MCQVIHSLLSNSKCNGKINNNNIRTSTENEDGEAAGIRAVVRRKSTDEKEDGPKVQHEEKYRRSRS